jgi:hypothetical protein
MVYVSNVNNVEKLKKWRIPLRFGLKFPPRVFARFSFLWNCLVPAIPDSASQVACERLKGRILSFFCNSLKQLAHSANFWNRRVSFPLLELEPSVVLASKRLDENPRELVRAECAGHAAPLVRIALESFLTPPMANE